MSSGEKRERTNPRKITLTVLKILREETEATRHLHIAQIVQRLETGYGIYTNRDTVRRVLNDLQEFYPVRCEELRREQNGERQRYTYGYWYEHEFVLQEAEVRVSQRVQDNILFLRRVLKKNNYRQGEIVTVDFQFNGYGSDGKSHPTENPPIINFLPLKICMAYGQFYLIGAFSGKKDLAHIRVDLMTHLCEHGENVALDEAWRYARRRLEQEWNAGTYLSSHLYMTYERGEQPRRITLRVKKWGDRKLGSLTFLHDAFGEHITPKPGTESDASVDVEVLCLPKAIEIFAWNYIDRVEVIGPEDVKKSVEKALREKWSERRMSPCE